MTKTDLQLKADIESELRWDPKINPAQIGVTVNKGVVTLMGTVDTYGEKWAAEAATKRVGGVRTVAQDLAVKVLTDHKRNDTEIGNAVQNALTWDVCVPREVTAKVERGAVTLDGKVQWNYQREAAEHAVRFLMGVTSVSNNVTLLPQASVAEVKEKVQEALKRQATADAKGIHVEISDGKVTLTGHASSWQSIHDATNAAWAAPGVTQVVDKMTVAYSA